MYKCIFLCNNELENSKTIPYDFASEVSLENF